MSSSERPTNLADLGAGELLERFAARDATPSDAVRACLARMDAREPQVSAIRTRCDDAALAAARQSDERWVTGTARPLEGVPFLVKDIIDTAGVLTTLGSAPERHRVPEHNATAVQRVLDAGGVLVGKTTVSEFAFGDAREDHRTTNPWDPSRWAGGSSTGSAVALASRLAPLALGTDTGGSIRVPGSYSGVTGLKPTFGRVPRDGVSMVSWTLDHTGPMARHAVDVARLLAVMSGACAADPVSVGPAFAYPDGIGATADLRGVRLGVPTNWFTEDCDPAVLALFEAAVDVLVSLGATRHAVHVDHADAAGIISWTITVAEFASMREQDLDRLESVTPSAAERAIGGLALGAFDYLKALRSRHLVQQGLDRVFAEVDVILTPASPSIAPRFGLPVDWAFAGGDIAWLDRIARNFLIGNITGVPSLVCPAGFTDGMPVGLQVLAPPFADGRCLRIGAAFQTATDHHTFTPPNLA